MTNNLPADNKRRNPPANRQRQQGKAVVSHQAGKQVRKINAAGNPPAVQRVNAPASRNGNGQVRPRPVTQRPPAQKQASAKQISQKQTKPKDKIPVKPFVFTFLFLVLAGVIIFFVFFMTDEAALIKKSVQVEVGTSASLEMFLEGQPKYPQYLSTNLDFSTIDYNVPQTVFFVITLYGIDHDCELVVADTVPPTGEAVTQELFSVDPIPDASECVTNIKDKTAVTVTWADKPDISEGGEFTASAKLTDAGGNETIVLVPLSVTRDSVAPVITGTRDVSIIVGETISYRTGVEVTDNYDKNPRLDIDTSGVQLDKPGDYQAVYRAVDFTGNVTEITIKVKIKAKPKNYVEPDVVYAQAKKILD